MTPGTPGGFADRLSARIEYPSDIGYKALMEKPVRTTQISMPEGFLDLGRGDPQLALLPLDLLRRAAEGRLSQTDNSFLQYGPEQGDGYLRQALAGFLAGEEAASADPER